MSMQHCGSSATLADFDAPFGCQRHAGGLQRLFLMQHLGSSVAVVLFNDPFLCSFRVPVRHWRIPATHFYAASRLQRRTAGLQGLKLPRYV